jgi:hypothetical protein
MRAVVTAALVAGALGCGGTAKPAVEAPLPDPPACPPASPPARVEILLHAALADASGIGPLAASFDVSPQRLLVIEDRARVYLLGWGGVVPVDGLAAADAFAYTPDGLLMTVRGTQLSYLAPSGALAPMLELPSAHMGIVAGIDSMYVFERESARERFGMFELAPGGKARLLFESPQPIDDAAQAGKRLFVVAGGAVFEATEGQPMRVLASLPGERRIRSVAADAATGRVYVSDGRAVFSLLDGCVGLMSSSFGGTVRVRDGALLVLDPVRRVVVRFPGVP